MDNDTTEAIQNVVDRVSSYQDGATEGTVADELRKGLAEIEVDLDDHQVTELADAIEADAGEVSVAEVLG